MYNIFQAILEKLLAKSEVRGITIQLQNYINGFNNNFKVVIPYKINIICHF